MFIRSTNLVLTLAVSTVMLKISAFIWSKTVTDALIFQILEVDHKNFMQQMRWKHYTLSFIY